MKEKYPDSSITSVITDELLTASIIGSPIACTYFFDELGQIGTLHYNKEDNNFLCIINCEIINMDANHKWSEDRLTIEKTLVSYLFLELEKTL